MSPFFFSLLFCRDKSCSCRMNVTSCAAHASRSVRHTSRSSPAPLVESLAHAVQCGAPSCFELQESAES